MALMRYWCPAYLSHHTQHKMLGRTYSIPNLKKGMLIKGFFDASPKPSSCMWSNPVIHSRFRDIDVDNNVMVHLTVSLEMEVGWK